MIFFYRRVHRTQFRTRLVKSGSRSESREEFRHAMRALGYHCRPEMMGTAGDIRDDLGLLRVRDGRLEHANDRAGAITLHAAELNLLANHRRIFAERVRPETIRENNDARSLGTIILRSDQASEHGTQPHDVEIGPVDHTAVDFTRLAQAEDGEGNS